MKISGVTYTYRKRHTVRNILLWIMILALLASIVVASLSAYTGWKVVHPARKKLPEFTSNIVPEHKDVSFHDIHGKVNLKGWFFGAGSKRCIILAHGYASNRLPFNEETFDMVKAFLDQNYNVLLFDFRASGESEGDLCSVGIHEKDDLLGAVAYVKKQYTMDNITVLGYSMGASSALMAAAESKDIDAVIADSPFSDLSDYLNEKLPVWTNLPGFVFNKPILLSLKVMKGLDPSKASPRKVIPDISPRPILFIHSQADTSIPIKNSQELYESYLKVPGGRAEFWGTENASHIGSYLEYKDEYIQRVLTFVDSVYHKDNP